MKFSRLLDAMSEVTTPHNTGYIIFAPTGQIAGLSEQERTYFFQFSGDSVRRNGKIILSSYKDKRYPHHDIAPRNMTIPCTGNDDVVEDCGFVTFTLICWCGAEMRLLGDFPTWKDAYETMRKSVARSLHFDNYDAMMSYAATHSGFDIDAREAIVRVVNQKTRNRDVCVWRIITTMNTGTSVKVFP